MQKNKDANGPEIPNISEKQTQFFSDFSQKMLWIAVPALIGVGATFYAGDRMELQIVVYAILVLTATFGIWVTNARKHRKEREKAEELYRQKKDAEEREWREELTRRLDRGDRSDRVLLRNELVRMHRDWVEEKGYITLEALEYAQNTYEAYNELRGNGSGTKLWHDIKALPVKN